MHATIIVINKVYRDQPGLVSSAVGHVCQSLGIQAARTQPFQTVTYRDADGNAYPDISVNPVLVMSGTPSRMWALWELAGAQAYPRGAYFDTMVSGGSDVQVGATAARAREELVPVVMGVFGARDSLESVTRKFSLYK